MKKYFQSMVTLLILFIISFPLSAQELNLSSEKTEISGGAEFDQLLQEAIKEGNLDMFRPSIIGPPIASVTEGANFLGFNFDDNATENGGFVYIPPDPIGAAGIDRIIAVVNVMIECRNKTGTLLFRDALRDFFSPLSPTTATFDPKVIYDQYENRFVVITLERVNSGSNPNAGNISRILLAVSKNSSPATATSADWWYYAMNGAEVIGGLDYWADYPGFAVDEEAVYITANMFVFPPFSGGAAYTRLWIVDKGVASGFYSGGTATSTKYDFPTLSGGFAGTHQPAHVFGSGGVGPGVGTFLVYYSGVTFGGPGGAEVIQVIRIDNPLGAISFSNPPQYVNIGDIEDVGGVFGFPALADAPQLGPPAIIPIEVNDRRTLHSVWRDNSLWLTTTINPNSGPDAGQTTAHWIEINTSTLAALVLADQGNIGGEDIATDTYTFFPSIAVNGNKDAMICFSASAATIYGGAYYTGRRFGDPAGTVGPSQTMKAGLDYYIRTFGGARNRWGDYSGASVDPSDDQTFWAFNEYAETRGTLISGEDGRWGTVFTSIAPSDPLPVELTNFSAEIIDKSINLKWQTATEVDNYGFEIERSVNLATWQNIGFIEGYGNSNSPKEYSFVDSKVSSGIYLYRLKQIDNDGTFDYSNEVEVNFSSPKKFELTQNYPNPFNPITNIQFTLPNDANVKLKVLNVLGESASILVDEQLTTGVHDYEFDAAKFPSGIYFYTLETDGEILATKKMILLK